MTAMLRRRPSAALTIAAATVTLWLSIIAVALALDDGSNSGSRAAVRDAAIHTPSARPGRAGPGYIQETPER
jgi:hypothetical protein